MKTSITQFLADLYEIDPSLKAHEAELKPLLEKLIAEDPSSAPDSAFVQKLRMQLRDHVANLEEQSAGSVWQRFGYLFSAGITAAVIIPIAVVLTNQQPLTPGAPLFSNSVETTGKNAFGNLSDIVAGNTMVGTDARSMRPQSGGGGPENGAMPTTAVESYGMMDDRMIMPWPQVQYRYVFSGALTDLQDTVSVYKRNFKPLTIPLSALADKLNMGGLNMGSFNGMNVESVSFVQPVSYGYRMYVNMLDSSVSIDANYEKWPQSKCQTEACWQAERVKIGDVLSDTDAISIAQAFAKDHGIDLSIYGTPEVDNNWRRDYDRATDKSLVYVPDQQRVIFPQLVDGKPVYDQSGLKTGLSISVQVKEKKVMNVYGIGDHSYLTSDYAGVTDAAAIQTFLSGIDNYNYYIDPAASVREGGAKDADVKKVTVILGAPTLSYAQYYRYTQNRNDELLIPSLVFPVERVEGETENAYYRQQVVVPLSKEMLEEMSKRPEVMPMGRGGVIMDTPQTSVEPVVIDQ